MDGIPGDSLWNNPIFTPEKYHNLKRNPLNRLIFIINQVSRIGHVAISKLLLPCLIRAGLKG
jgi:hypothetical protein